jgi:hypothetical protein
MLELNDRITIEKNKLNNKLHNYLKKHHDYE